MSDIDTAVVDSLKALDPNRPIREADVNSRHCGVSRSAVCRHPPCRLTFVRALIRRESELGRLPVGGRDQALGDQQQRRNDQRVDEP